MSWIMHKSPLPSLWSPTLGGECPPIPESDWKPLRFRSSEAFEANKQINENTSNQDEASPSRISERSSKTTKRRRPMKILLIIAKVWKIIVFKSRKRPMKTDVPKHTQSSKMHQNKIIIKPLETIQPNYTNCKYVLFILPNRDKEETISCFQTVASCFQLLTRLVCTSNSHLNFTESNPGNF